MYVYIAIMRSGLPPAYWPKNFIYSSVSQYVNSDLHAHFIRHILSSQDPGDIKKIVPCLENQTVHSAIKILKITKKIHPEHPLADQEIFKGHFQHGVFVSSQIEKGTELGEYVGEVFSGSKQESSEPVFKGVHIWTVPFGGLPLSISSLSIANELAFVNDYRGIQKAPNVKPKWIMHRGFYYFGFVATRDIRVGEEVLVDYGAAWARSLCSPQKGFL